MAIETSFDIRAMRLALPLWVVEAAFVGLVAIVFIGRAPFMPPPPILANGVTLSAGAGDLLRQLSYLAVFAVILIGALQKRGLSAFSAVPWALAFVVVWCMASAFWAAAPGVAFRRAALEGVLLVSVMMGVDTIGWERALGILRWALVAILAVNWFSIPLVATAVHLPGELDPGLVGDWRGLYSHKNTAGAMSALTAILFLFSAIEKKSMRDAIIVAFALGFLVMTRSKSSLGLLPVALVAGAIYRFSWRSSLDRALACVGALVIAAGVIALLYANLDPIVRVLEDPAEFTGRTAIWQAELAYVRDHPLLGAGFGTFADTGGTSPLLNYVGGNWVTAVSHGHSGYLQLLVTIGAIGFVLAVIGFVVTPLASFWPIERKRLALRALLFTIFVFFVLHNFMESDFLEDDGQAGVAFLLMLAMLGASQREERDQGEDPCLLSSRS